MSKTVIEDIRKERKSLREVLPSKNSQHASTPRASRASTTTSDMSSSSGLKINNRKTKSASPMFWLWGAIIVIGVVVLGGYFVSPIFTKVTISITPKTLTLDTNEIITANRDSVSDDLIFTVLPQAEETISINTPATGEEYVEAKASGKIRITNNFSSSPQPLVATTRFTSEKGNVYRIADGITVPGMKNNQPGTIDVMVYADKIGSEYNDNLTSFTIPGFASSDKFKDITAKSITPMTGGVKGTIKVVSTEAEEQVRQQITSQLNQSLMELIKSQTPDGFFTNSNLIKFTYVIKQETKDGQAGSNAVFSGTGMATAIILNEHNFTQKLVAQALNPESAKNPIKIENIEELTIEPNISMKDSNLAELDAVDLKIIGKIDLLWKIDEQKLIRELSGQPKEAFAEVFKSYGESIVGGEVVFKPSWSKKFPTDTNRIEIELPTYTDL